MCLVVIVHCVTGLLAQWTLLRGWLGSLVSGIVLWLVTSGPRKCRPTWLVVCCSSHNFGFRDGVYLFQQVIDSSIYFWLEAAECTAK